MRCLLAVGLALLPSLASAEPVEDQVLVELNNARTDPKGLAVRLKQFRATFDRDNNYRTLGNGGYFRSFEGVSAVDEAITFLEKQAPLPPVTSSPLLTLAAQDHTREQGQRGTLGHMSHNGSMPWDRVMHRGGGRVVGETVSYAMTTGIDVVVKLIVDDNEKERGHRTIIFYPQYLYAGVACGPHKYMRYMCTIDFSTTAMGGSR